MTDRILHVHIENEDTFFTRVRMALQQAATDPNMEPKEHLTFSTYEQWLSVFSARRIEIIESLKAMGATSIRALSKAVARDYKSVHQDVQRLIEIGVVAKRDDGLIEAPYDRIVTDMRFGTSRESRSHQPALLDGRRDEARKKRVRLERA